MSWLKLRLPADRDLAPRLADAFDSAGALSVSIEAAEDQPILQAALEEVPLWDKNWVIGLFPEYVDVSAVMAQLGAVLGGLPAPETDLLPNTDWAFAWMARYKPFEAVPGLWICPTWLTPPAPHTLTILLDPGLAFGTGEHPTTALCLEWLLAQPLAGKTVLDYGCGSGILSIAALKRGAARAIGVDVDPQALRVARDNAERNEVASRFETLLPDDLPADFAADVVVANILSNILVELAPGIVPSVNPQGRLALSGLLAEQTDDVRKAYDPPFDLIAKQRSGWMLLAGSRRGGS